MTTNRLGIFAFYEKNGIVEDYVVCLLKELRGSVNRLIFVYNGVLSDSGRLRLAGLVDEIRERENRGYDAGAFREVLLDFIEHERLNDFDEIVLCNDTFFGPFVPLEDIFTEMGGRGLDFWGLSSQPVSTDCWIGADDIVPAFIQSFFVVIGRKMFTDKRFEAFWRSLGVNEWNLTQVVKNYEQRFTAYFEGLGYRWGTYTDNSFFEGEPAQNNFTPYLMMPYELIKYGNCPFLKKKCITGKDIAQGMEPDNGGFAKALDYIQKNTDYDINMIKEYMINHCNKEIIADKLKLSYIIPRSAESVECDFGKLGIVVNMQDKQQINIVNAYLRGLSEQISVYYADGSGKLDKSALLDRLPEGVEFICLLQDDFVNDTERTGKESAYTRISECEQACANLIGDDHYIASVMKIFEQDAYLGILRAAGRNIQDIWNEKEEQWNFCWIRKSVLESDLSFYVGAVWQEQYAAVELCNAPKVKSLVFGAEGASENHNNEIDSITSLYRSKLFDFCAKQEKLYLYGTGGVATRTAYALQKKGIHVDGFIVSDGQPMERELIGYKVYFVSEVDLDNAGVVVSVEERLYKVITKVLDDKGMKNYIYSCY